MARVRRAKTEEEKRRDRNQRLKRLYGITLKEYEERLAQQGGCCAICRKPPATMTLSVDHDHKWKYLKIVVHDCVIGWVAKVDKDVPPTSPYYISGGVGDTKQAARKMLKQRLQRASVRGLLCFSCNGGLRKYRDNPSFLENAAQYLRDHQGS